MPSQSPEFQLIESIRRLAGSDPRIALGIGDDAAVVQTSEAGKNGLLVAVDMLLEGTHFTLPPATARDVGRKALAVNLSDIAAMAGEPFTAFVSVALPRGRGSGFALEVHEGLLELAAEFGVVLAGGDTNAWDGPLVISVTVLGEATGNGAVRRSGAKVGDWIMTTGQFGGSLAGRHLRFQPRVAEALKLHETVSLHAMIDVSDGLCGDLYHILDESAVGAVLFEAAIPVSDEAARANDGRSPLQHALADGEDFELLFTVSPADGQRLLDSPPFPLPISHVGEIVFGNGCELQDASGRRVSLPPSGWTHRF